MMVPLSPVQLPQQPRRFDDDDCPRRVTPPSGRRRSINEDIEDRLTGILGRFDVAEMSRLEQDCSRLEAATDAALLDFGDAVARHDTESEKRRLSLLVDDAEREARVAREALDSYCSSKKHYLPPVPHRRKSTNEEIRLELERCRQLNEEDRQLNADDEALFAKYSRMKKPVFGKRPSKRPAPPVKEPSQRKPSLATRRRSSIKPRRQSSDYSAMGTSPRPSVTQQLTLPSILIKSPLLPRGAPEMMSRMSSTGRNVVDSNLLRDVPFMREDNADHDYW